MKVSATASAGAERVAPNSSAIGFSATTVVSGAPYDTLSTMSATVATTQDVRVSTLLAYGAAAVHWIRFLGSCHPGFPHFRQPWETSPLCPRRQHVPERGLDR